MDVKRTKNQKYSIPLTLETREKIFVALCNFLEDESVKLMSAKLINEYEVMRSLYYNILNEMTIQKEFKLQINVQIKWTLSRSEATALMWLLRGYDNEISLFKIKSGLHKQLISA